MMGATRANSAVTPPLQSRQWLDNMPEFRGLLLNFMKKLFGKSRVVDGR
jgi:hypothetical protein